MNFDLDILKNNVKKSIIYQTTKYEIEKRKISKKILRNNIYITILSILTIMGYIPALG